MATATTISVILIVLGALVLLFGRRVFMLAAGVGALLGVGLLSLVPGQQEGVIGLLLVFGLAIVGGLLGIFVKGLSHLVVTIIGFVAGGAITLGILDGLGLSLGLLGFILALIGAVIGLVLANRFFDWAIVILAALTGALLVARGFQLLTGQFTGSVGTIIWIALAVVGFIYLSRGMRARS
jgi:hypothetical protein